jgi:hypothetical protein
MAVLDLGTLKAAIQVDNSQYKKSLEESQSHTNKFSDGVLAALKKIGAAIAAAFTVRVVVDFVKECISGFADLE